MSPRKQHAASGLARVENRDRAGARAAFAPFERQIGELGADLGERLGGLEPELGLGVDGAAERGDAVGYAARVLKQVFGQHGAVITRRAAAIQRRSIELDLLDSGYAERPPETAEQRHRSRNPERAAIAHPIDDDA